MSKLYVDVCSHSPFVEGVGSADADDVRPDLSNWHAGITTLPSRSVSDDFTQVLGGPFDLTPGSNEKLQSSLEEAKGPLNGLSRAPSSSSGLNYTLERPSDAVGKLQHRAKHQDHIEVHHSVKGRYEWENKKNYEPRSTPKLSEEDGKTTAPFVGQDTSHKVSTTIESDDDLHEFMPAEYEHNSLHGADASEKGPILKRQSEETHPTAELKDAHATKSSSSPDGLNSNSWVSVRRKASDGTETNSINSFEDDFTEDSDEGGTSARQDDFREVFIDQMADFLDSWLRRLPISQHTGRAQSSASPNSRDLTSMSPESNFINGAGKRQSSNGKGDDSAQQGNGGNGGRKRTKGLNKAQESEKRWACPFYQKDPVYYSRQRKFGDYHKCAEGPGFTEVHRVKNHIFKYHTAIYCRRCYCQFMSDEELDLHHQAPEECEPRNPQPLEGISNQAREKMKPRDRNPSEYERWKNIYRFIFPDDTEIPSPYYVYHPQPETLEQEEVLEIVRNTPMADSPQNQTQLILYRLEAAYNDRTGRLMSRMQNTIQGQSSSPTVISSPFALDNNQLSLEPMVGHHEILGNIEGGQEAAFGGGDVSAGTMPSGYMPNTSWNYGHGVGYGSSYPEGPMR